MAKEDLPSHLSDQQLFVLASILDRRGHVESLSRRVALEFDVDGERISSPAEPLADRVERALEKGETEKADLIIQMAQQPKHHNSRDRHIQNSHSASLSRSLSRLEERGLIRSTSGRGQREKKRTRVNLTKEGEDAAKEVLRRHSDGRYSLSFGTLD